ncbi:hypothetical protein RclHR1_03260005 [Rhizophagus clarus]|uniref:Uncharacterized protein n=1 Tax=Rhizophagus clarus TaxID=94130 RepID=A0A2Z6R897_9GLOM|nr:hypothetical protein RclHR1_03260005 [Rhizophagus clarus]GES76944.1 hypothetical protein GLOIN_2v1778477 [Rhizophagus clarus]
MSYTSIPTEPENATTAIGGRRYSSDEPTRMFILPNTNDDFNSIPSPTGSQLRRSSKIGRSSGEFKRQSIRAKLSTKYKLVSPENEKPQHLKIVMPLPSQLSNDLKDEQEIFSTHSNNKTLKEILKMPWIDENDNKFSKKFWLIFVISLLILFGVLIVGFGIYAYNI